MDPLGQEDLQYKFNNNPMAVATGGPQYMVQAGEEVDENGRVVRGPVTLKNGAIYTGQWLNGVRDGYGS